MYLKGKLSGIGGLSGTISTLSQEGVQTEPLQISENGTYEAPYGKGYSPVEVNVPGFIPTGTLEVTENGTYDVTYKAETNVSVKQWDTELKKILDGSATALNNLPQNVGKIKPYAFYHNTRKLPDGYAQLESVYFGGDSVFETDIPYRAVPVVSISAKSDGQKSASQVLYGYERGGNGGTYFGVMPNTTLWSLGSSFNFTNAFQRTDITISNTVVSNRDYSISATIGGETKTRTGTSQGTYVNIMIGGCITSQDAITFPFYGHVYGDIQARIDGALAYDYVPAKRTSDNKVGYYDIINNVFKLPFGSDLVGGAEIPTEDMKSIQTADLSVTEIGAFAFHNNELSSLTLRANQVVTLGENALEGTPIADGNGRIYVPVDLVSAYQADASWSAYASVIESL